MIAISEILNQSLFGISVKKLGLFFTIILLTFIIKSIFMYTLSQKLTVLVKKTKTELDDQVLSAIKSPLGYLILLQGFYLAIQSLQLSENIWNFVYAIYILAFSFIILFFLFKIIDIIAYYLYREAKKTDSTLDDQLIPLLVKSLRILVVTLGILFILQNKPFDYNITSLLAGLGIGGLAFALAAQNTVSNLFGSITIFSDKPFQLGDWISVGEIEGTVEEVGFRTTRVRQFDQALVTVPNSQFINTGIINYSAMKKRRINFNLGITYGTSTGKIEEAVAGIKKIIEEDEKFDHSFYMVRFTEFGAYSLNIFIYCFTKTTDWAESLAIREELNLKIMRLLEELGIEIAFPSQTIYLKGIKGGN
ncbi:Small-conductance mechanosensitive ion channel [Candidatus Methanoperedens nitroreducens]|uniref:Small-conductance mechanosensitive ion channel n=2 Tax=Candidatus Methanoperedens nitratireducens TaxID=1392998 RepID=A0A284VM15_9EURY|nr:Small-conductance mechanosensitive ion channel [Candidatus Methanoperedens nitroreducens]